MKTYIPLATEEVLGERLKADEATTSLALLHQMPLDFTSDDSYDENVEDHCLATLRTGAIYILDDEHANPALESMIGMPLQEFPPLPFPRIVIETHKDGKPSYFFSMIKIITIVEVIRGQQWDVVYVTDVEKVTRDDFKDMARQISMDTFFSGFSLRRNDNNNGTDITMIRRARKEYAGKEADLEAAYRLMTLHTVNLIHMITARNAPKEKALMPRSQRKAFKQKYKIEPPTVYRVRLDQAGDQEGVSGWHYKVRFVVCGHYRPRDPNMPNRRWIEPYFKGPAGAPWKGRPIHEKDS